MKKVVFSEGKNDVTFLTKIHENLNMDLDYNCYIAEEFEVSQTTWLRQHKVDNRFGYLYKSEEGLGNLIKQFRAHSLLFDDMYLCLLVDLDGGSFNSFMEDINGKLHEDYGNKVRISEDDREMFQDLYVINATLEITMSEDNDLPIIAFYENLESAANINRGDDRHVKDQKIEHYLEQNPDVIDSIESSFYDVSEH